MTFPPQPRVHQTKLFQVLLSLCVWKGRSIRLTRRIIVDDHTLHALPIPFLSSFPRSFAPRPRVFALLLLLLAYSNGSGAGMTFVISMFSRGE
jgi:hypothetical protein